MTDSAPPADLPRRLPARHRPHLAAGLTLALALGLVLPGVGMARPTGAAGCPSSPVEGAARCDRQAARGQVHAEPGDIWVALDPIDLLIRASTEGRAGVRSLAAHAGGSKEPEPPPTESPAALAAAEPDAAPASEPRAPAEADAPPQPPALASSLELPSAEPPLPRPPGASPPRAAFILTAAEAARESQRETGVPASVAVAQAILESDWGGSRLSAEFNNFFGIKAHSRPGTAGVVWFNTWEHLGGRDVTVKAPFRAYTRPADSFVDHGRFFHENPRYALALAARDDPRQFAREINRAGYATDPNYAPKLIALMDRYNLYAYDIR